MNQDWYSQFFSRMTQELMEHIAEDVQQMVMQLMGGISLESLLNNPNIQEILGQLGGFSGFQGQSGSGFQTPSGFQMGDAAYRMLGLEKTASDAEVKARYRDLAKKLHPDVAGSETTHLFQLIQAAYEQIARERGWRYGKGGQNETKRHWDTEGNSGVRGR
jgi:DnaJ-domain-containing protein 1